MTTLIKNGTIYDGTLETVPFQGDILISGERIIEIAPHIQVEGARVIDAAGRAVTPGFIDVHRHGDLHALFDDFGIIELAQGLTTIGMGVCGFSFAPYTTKSEGLYPYVLSTHGASFDGARYATMAEYLQALHRSSLGVNVSTLQGLGAIRLAVKGYDPSPFTPSEMAAAQDYVRQAMDCGLRGFSTGLVYLPEVYNSTEEMMALLSPCKSRDMLYMPHMRDEASRLVEAVEESIKIARENEMALGISHFKALGPENWHGTLERAIEKIEQARADGMDVTVDFYPYHGTATTLASILPASFLTEDFSKILAKITAPESIDRMRYCYQNPGPNDEIMDLTFRWNHAMISGVTQPENRKYLGKTVHECSQMAGYDDEIPFIANLLASENGSVSMVGLNIDPKNIERIAKLPYSMVISDSLYNETDTPHPRIYASFTHMIRHFVLDEHVLTLQEAVHKMTQLPAQRMRYRDRGILKTGAYADVLVFDPQKIGDNATFDHSKVLSTGIEAVLVNGEIAWQNEQRLGSFGVCLN